VSSRACSPHIATRGLGSRVSPLTQRTNEREKHRADNMSMSLTMHMKSNVLNPDNPSCEPR
jgi:hypothetical protein